MEITRRQYIDSSIKKQKTIRIYRLLAICKNMFVTVKSLGRTMNVSVQSIKINDYSYTERRKEKNYSLYIGYKLFLSENQFEYMKVDYSIASIPSFRIDVSPSSESIQFGTKMSRIEPDNKYFSTTKMLIQRQVWWSKYLTQFNLKVFIIY